MIGQSVSHYKILEKLGGGGMGVVYKAEDTKLKRTVALKFLPADVTHEDDTKVRFIHEAQAASAIQHNNICNIHDIDETDDGQLFIVMDHYGGGSLKRRLQSGALEMTEALEIALQIAEGLEETHKRGIVHRDIKPANIMLAENGVAKIVDFGLAKLAGAAKLTRSGSTLGTFAYMSPEQLRGEEIDTRTDIFSFGVLLYEMLTGRLPFRGEVEASLVYSIIDDTPEVIEKFRTDVDPRISAIVSRCLEKNRENRFHQLDDCIIELRKVLRHEQRAPRKADRDSSQVRKPARQSTPRKYDSGWLDFAMPRPNKFFLFIAGLILIGAFVTIYFQTSGRPEETNGAPVPATFAQVTDQDGAEVAPVISPGGEFVVYMKAIDGKRRLFLQRIGGRNPIDLTKDSNLEPSDLKLSPDGNLIAFSCTGKDEGIYVVGTTGESLRRVADVGGDLSWLPDGRKLLVGKATLSDVAAAHGGELWLIDLSSGEKKLMANGAFREPFMSPHGKRVAFWREQKGRAGIFTMPREGEILVPVTPDSFRSVSPIWSPDGKFIYFQSDRGGTWNIWRIAIDEETGELRGVPRPIQTPAGNSLLGSIASDGKRVVFMTTWLATTLLKVPIDAVNGKVIGKPSRIWSTNTLDIYGKMVHSPDGEWIAATNSGNSSAHSDIFIIPSEGGDARKLTDDPEQDLIEQWSADGRKLVFVSNRNNQGYQAWSMNPDGSGLEQLTKLDTRPAYVSLLPDGKTLTFERYFEGTCTMDLTKPLDQRKPELLPLSDSARYRFHAWSVLPDGERLFGGFADSGLKSVLPGSYIYDLRTRKYTKVLEQAYAPARWCKDSRHFVFANKGEFYLVDIVTKEKKLLLRSSDYTGRPARNGGISPDSKFLYLIDSNHQSDIWLATLKED